MRQPGSGIVPNSLQQKKKLLQAIYGVYSGWTERFPLACQKGCADCCTRSVTMSSLEGSLILDFAEKNGLEEWLRKRLAPAVPEDGRAVLTMNRFAAACLAQREIGDDGSGSWNFTPCVFLEQDVCTIYEARPFGCRSFGSFVRCSTSQTAEMAPIHLAVNTAFTQVIEHLDSDGGCWGNMAGILANLLGMEDGSGSTGLQQARPVPGFLLQPREVKVVRDLFQQLKEQSAGQNTISDLIDNFMPIE